MSAVEVATRTRGWSRLIVASLVGGVAFNLAQRQAEAAETLYAKLADETGACS